VLRRFDRVLAASATTVAWVAAGCDRGECPVHRTDLASGRDATVPSPPDAWATGGVFSPDGRYLALTFSFHPDPYRAARSQSAAVLDARTGRLLPVPGSTIDAELGLGLGWSSSGAGDAWLLLSMPRTVHAQGQVGAWRLAPGGLAARRSATAGPPHAASSRRHASPLTVTGRSGTTSPCCANSARSPASQADPARQAPGRRCDTRRVPAGCRREDDVSSLSDAEIEYLASQRLGRLATVGQDGVPHVVPVTFRYNPEADAIDIGGHDFAKRKKFRDVQRTGVAAFVVDDVPPPWRPRGVEVRGRAAILGTGGKAIQEGFDDPIIRITPGRIVSWGLKDGFQARSVG
jgi:pyridoxamine 5'-phosphate oxidase family protein